MLVIPAQAGIQGFRVRTGIEFLAYLVPCFGRDEVWIPGRVSLARNDNSIFREFSNRGFVTEQGSYKAWDFLADGMRDSQGTPVWQRPQP